MKATVNNIKAIAKANDLEVIETTTGINDYPQNVKYAVIGFENYEQINDFINGFKINGHPEIFTKKDGWRFWERTGNVAYDAFEF